MFLIDKPYVSGFLTETIKKNNYPIVSTKVARELVPDSSLNWVSEKDAILFVEKTPGLPLYTNSENSIGWVASNLEGSNLAEQVQLFKDKIKFRELIQKSFPNFFFKPIDFEAIDKLKIADLTFPFVIKPALGFFSLGVHIVHNPADWEKAKSELNLETLQSIYPKEVLDTTTFIIEEFVEGEEYAIDYYYNKTGEVVILNVMHHKFSSGTDISDRVYSTSKEILLRYKKEMETFLAQIGRWANLRNFPAHIEIRVDAGGKIVPIEMNPMRFGGWCTTGDISWNAFGINSYEYFIDNIKPDWDRIFSSREDKIYSIIVLNNNSGCPASEIAAFNYKLLALDFENAFIIRELDVNEFSFFGFVFAETRRGNEKELDDILTSDLRKYIVRK